MSFESIPAPLVGAGALAIAGLLYLLQRLRTRPRVVLLPAAALWHAAARAAPLRVLGPRFRYWLAFLLALAISLLLWVAAAHPAPSLYGRAGEQLFYLDLSAGLSDAGTAARAERALLADVRATPAARRAVYLGDGDATVLLEPGESASLLAHRLDGLAPAARPSVFAGWMALRSTMRRRGDPPTAVRYYGDWPSARSAHARRLPSMRLTYGFLAEPVTANRGIVALGATPAASGRWMKSDILFDLVGTRDPDAVRWTLDGAPLVPERVERIGPAGFALHDVDAAGGLLRAVLRQGDRFRADDQAELRLPDRRPIRVAVTAGVPASVTAAVRADDAFVMTSPDRAQVIVRRDDEADGGTLPTLVLSSATSQTAAFLFSGPDENAGTDLVGRLDEFGLAQVDAKLLADGLHRPISVDVGSAPRRTIAVWRDLFDARGSFVHSATMPLFVSRGLHWLTGGGSWIPFAKAGAPLIDQSGLYGLGVRGGLNDDALGTDLRLGAAGGQRMGDRSIAVSLTDRRVSEAVVDPTPPPPVSGLAGRGPPDLVFVLLLLAAGIGLMFEWWLFQRGLIP